MWFESVCADVGQQVRIELQSLHKSLITDWHSKQKRWYEILNKVCVHLNITSVGIFTNTTVVGLQNDMKDLQEKVTKFRNDVMVLFLSAEEHLDFVLKIYNYHSGNIIYADSVEVSID